MNKLEKVYPVDKERLYIKLFLFSLKRTKEFILSQYDEKLALQMSSSAQEDFYMLTFCFKSLEPEYFGDNFLNSELKDCYRELMKKMKQITTSKELYDFAKNDIDEFISLLQFYLKKVSW